MRGLFMESKHRDVIVIGGGMAGLLTAYYLQEQGKNVLVLEAKEIASGQTGRTTAKITSQHGLKYDKLIHTVGRKKARLYAQANEAAIGEYERLIQKENIDCQFERLPAYLYTREQAGVPLLRKEAEAVSLSGIDAFLTEETELPFPVIGALCFRNQAQFSAVEFVQQIASKLEILEHTKVVAVKRNQVFTENEMMTADRIVMAAHYPFKNVPGFYFLRQHQERSYVLALEKDTLPEWNGIYYGIDKNAYSLRRLGDYLLLDGSHHRTGQCNPSGAYEPLMQAAKQYFPEYEVKAAWSAQDCMPHDGIPFIGKYSIFTPHLYVATGFQKWGMTTSMVAALLLRDEICGTENPYAKLFSPQRMNFRASIGNLLVDVGISIKGLTQGLFGKKERRCAHLGCKLMWNPDEKSWDCPCHGSRFDAEGKLLDNPATRNL